MNVGFVTHYYDRSEGTGGYAVEVVTRLARAHDVTLYAAAVRTPPPAGVTVVTVPALTTRAYTTILTFPRAFARVRRRHDVVHAQGWVTGDADVVTAHIVLAAWRAAARRHSVRPPLGERLLGGWVASRESALLARARLVIAPSRGAADDIRAATGRENGVVVVPHGCDRDMHPPRRAEARKRVDVPVAFFTAGWIGDARKGLANAVRALPHVPGAHLVVLTASDPAPYQRLSFELVVEDRLHFAPRGATAADVFGAADVIVQPSIYDTFGMVVGEALALGVPVVVSSRAGVAELIEDGTSGLVVEPTPEATAAALRALMASERLRERLAEGGRAVARQYTWDETVRRTVQLYGKARA